MPKKIGVARNHISELERGVSGVSIPSMMDICAVLQVDADYILFGKVTVSENHPLNLLFKICRRSKSCAQKN